MSTAARDAEIEIEQAGDLEREFKVVPAALLRGEASEILDLDFTGMTLRARAFLAAMLSLGSDFLCSRERLASLAPELQRDGLDIVLKELRDRGHLRQTRTHTDSGTFVWRWQVSLRPVDPPGGRPRCVVYFLRRRDGGIKIGTTVSLTRRLSHLKRDHGPLDLLATEPGGWLLERNLHGRFAAHRLDGEWFAPAPPLLRYVSDLTAACPDGRSV
jgi:Meiotically up-regulated gene 113